MPASAGRDKAMIELTQMTPAEFDDYLDHAVCLRREPDTQRPVATGEAPNLRKPARPSPDGRQTPGHQLLAIRV